MRTWLLLVSLLVSLLVTPAWADKLVWEYDLSTGAMPAFVSIERGPSSTGPFTRIATIPAMPATYVLGWPADSLWYRVNSPTNSPAAASNAVVYTVLPVPPPVTSTYDDTALKAALSAAETKLAGVCKAAKAMGGTASSFAGRMRKEIPCP